MAEHSANSAWFADATAAPVQNLKQADDDLRLSAFAGQYNKCPDLPVCSDMLPIQLQISFALDEGQLQDT